MESETRKGRPKPEKDRAWRVANAERLKAQAAAYRAANREKIKARDAARYAANREKMNAQAAAYRKANAEKLKPKEAARVKAWRKANPDKVKAGRIRYSNRHAEEEAAARGRPPGPRGRPRKDDRP